MTFLIQRKPTVCMHTEVHLLQMWITPEVREIRPSYEQKQFTRAERTGKLLALASGQGIPGAIKIHQDATLYASAMWPEDEISLKLGNQRKAYLFVINGELRLNDRAMEPVIRQE